MSDMDRIVNTESNSDHEVIARDSVYSDTPEVEESTNINQSKENTEDDDYGSSKITYEDECGEEYGHQSQSNVSVDLERDHLIRLPGGISNGPGEDPTCYVGVFDCSFDPVHGGDVFLGPRKQTVSE